MAPLDYLLVLVPVSLVLGFGTGAAPLWIFATAILAIVPLADWIRRATDQLARLAGPAVGGLLNVTFGNVSELILAVFILRSGQAEVVKGQITGSIIGNSLLGLGVAILIGSWGREQQRFKRERASLLSSLLVLAVIALLLPALFDYTERGQVPPARLQELDERLSMGVSAVLILMYIANLIYTLVTHRDVFAFQEDSRKPEWSLWRCLGVLALGTVLLAAESELVSDALVGTAQRLGLSEFFLGVTVLAVVGNAAEYVAASYFARKDKMGLAITITVGSSIQVALLVAPLLVFISYFLGHPMNLVFGNALELIALVAVAVAVNAIAQDGSTTWFEGLLLVAVYALLGLAFLFVTPVRGTL
jgi:Ca2+:H+ antiporter